MKIKNSSKIFILFALMIITAVNSPEIMNSVKASLSICFSAVVPSLFPFMILSSAFTAYADTQSFKLIAPFTRKILGISPFGAGAFICGIISGYPIGAKTVCELYTCGKITKSEAESLTAYSNNSGPLFVIGAVGVGIYNSVFLGICLYLVHIMCALGCAIVLRAYTYSADVKIKSTRQAVSFTECICQSVNNILKVCGFVVFFGVVCKIAEPAIGIFPQGMQCVLYSILEITNGIKYTASAPISKALKLSLTAGALSWSGISVHMQVKEIIKNTNLSLKKYFLAKACTSILSALIVYIAYLGTDSIALAINIEKTRGIFGLIALVSAVVILFLKHKKRGASSSFSERN